MMSTQTEDSSTIEENDYNIDFVIDVITKEAQKRRDQLNRCSTLFLAQNLMTH